MKSTTFDLPAMYADHHVVEVRSMLLGMPGVEDIYASSAFKVVEISFDESKVSEDEIKAKLEEAGYMGELPYTVESVIHYGETDWEKKAFRFTEAHQQTSKTISFAQKVNYEGRPLWPCPGVGAVKATED